MLQPDKYTFVVQLGNFLGLLVNEQGIKANSDKIQAVLDMQSLQRGKDIQKLTGCIGPLNRFISSINRQTLTLF